MLLARLIYSRRNWSGGGHLDQKDGRGSRSTLDLSQGMWPRLIAMGKRGNRGYVDCNFFSSNGYMHPFACMRNVGLFRNRARERYSVDSCRFILHKSIFYWTRSDCINRNFIQQWATSYSRICVVNFMHKKDSNHIQLCRRQQSFKFRVFPSKY